MRPCHYRNMMGNQHQSIINLDEFCLLHGHVRNVFKDALSIFLFLYLNANSIYLELTLPLLFFKIKYRYYRQRVTHCFVWSICFISILNNGHV